MKKSMGTDNLLEAAKGAIIWIEEIDEKGKQVKINKEKKKISLHYYWKIYFEKEILLR